ncbi:hypothetical protein N7456_000908 [Penicillium angulare]|uniref:Uncharacterized protein n=1 Tax=Penicillium angulare TaxID=116970 RepID=A0A9W9GE05_9EURO|nr:hypothetical protein N7456_000908 [Penicillium angulare]
MPWKHVSPNQYERPFDALETLYRAVADSTAQFNKHHYFITSVIKLKHQPSVPALQHAWARLRHQHPKIATVPNKTGTRLVYRVPSRQELESWMQTTFQVHFKVTSNAEVFDSRAPASTHFMLHYIPHSRELLFRSPQWRIDGIGMILLQNCFLTFLSNANSCVPDFDGSEVPRLPPGFERELGFALKITGRMQNAAKKELSVFANGLQPASLRPSIMSVATPGASQRGSVSFTKLTSDKIFAESKRRGLKVTTAVQAALFLTARQYMTPQDGALMCFNTYNIRNRLHWPWNSPQGATGLFHTGRPCSIDLSSHTDFASFASSLRAHYEQDLGPLFDFMIPYVQSVQELLAAPYELVINSPGAAHVEMSSLGVMNDRLQRQFQGPSSTIEIEDWWLGVHVANRILQTFVWTWDGKLNLSCHYNDAFYKSDFVEQFCRQWALTLKKELAPYPDVSVVV